MSFSDVADQTMRAPSARRGLLAGMLVAGALAVLPATAGAVVTNGPNGRIGYLPVNGANASSSASRSKAPVGPLTNPAGNPIMPSNKQFAIFWAPAGFSFPAGYEAGIVKFMKDVSADHNLPTDTYSVGAQYNDASGKFATSSMSFGGSLTDTNPIPASGCPTYTSPISGTFFPRCITDAQLSAEVDKVVNAHSFPRGLTNQYFMFLPPGVGSCFDSAGTQCFDKEFCAYHSANSTGGQTIYANESFTPIDPNGCGTGQYPNGHSSGIDDELSSLSHETNEAREDPLLNAWFNHATGAEGADQCRNTSDDYGPFLGGNPGTFFNQDINGGHYILQRDWSNAANGCEQRYNLSGTTFGPFKGKVGKKLEFSVKFKDREGGHLATAQWSFGDGSKANGASVKHKFTKPGKYTVNTFACTNTKVCLFGTRKVTIKKKRRHRGHHHKARVVAVQLHRR